MSQSDAAWHDVIWLSVSISLALLNVINSKKKFHNFEVEEEKWYCSISNEKSSTTIYSEYAPTAPIQAVQQGTIDPIRYFGIMCPKLSIINFYKKFEKWRVKLD